MTNDKVFLTFNWQDQNFFLTAIDFYNFLVNTACKEKRP